MKSSPCRPSRETVSDAPDRCHIGPMAKGPRGEKRAADLNRRAFDIVQIASGETDEPNPDAGKDPAAVALGRRGGEARADSLSKKRRSEIAKKAAKSRWKGPA